MKNRLLNLGRLLRSIVLTMLTRPTEYGGVLRSTWPIEFPDQLLESQSFGKMSVAVVSVSKDLVDLLREYTPALSSVPLDVC
jgi:hypothetical protein